MINAADFLDSLEDNASASESRILLMLVLNVGFHVESTLSCFKAGILHHVPLR
jgi:hypothetical protein